MDILLNQAKGMNKQEDNYFLQLLDEEDKDISLTEKALQDLLINDDETVHQENKLQEMRHNDPFFYFSIPGALTLDFVANEDYTSKVMTNFENKKVERKTRVSCEVHSDVIFEDIMHELKQEMKRSTKKQHSEAKDPISKLVQIDEDPLKHHRRLSSDTQQRNGMVAQAA